MNALELNKLVGALLLGGMVALVSGLLAQMLTEPRHTETASVALPEGSEPATSEPTVLEPVSPLLAAADIGAGETQFKKCATCHTTDKGGPNKVGPNLWGIVGGSLGHNADFAYSDALKAKGGNWDYESLNVWLASPKSFVPGTKMAFAGIKKVQDRANLIAWLRNQSDSPPALPDQAAIDAALAAAAPAAETATTAAAGETTAATDTTAATATTATGEQTASAPTSSIADLLKTADPAAGKQVAKKCTACHSFDKGGPNKVGPNLWDIVGGKQAHSPDYAYSDAIKNLGSEWTYEELDKYLASPKTYAPGTKMAFAGVKKVEDRAALIAYLRSLSDSPKPLP